MSQPIRAFQIFYNEATRSALDPDFEPLDNCANERPDWYEYWPIRNYFRAHALDNSAYYGFFSPLFSEKTRLSARQVKEFAAGAGDVEVITFSPHPCHGAVFYNVFEQGGNCFPGFLEAAARVFHELDPAIRLEAVVNDSRNTVYGNYFLAKASFWHQWNHAFNRLFELAETRGSPLHEVLNRPVEYAKNDGVAKPAQMKIMLMERVAPLMLAARAFRTKNYPPFAMPLSAPFVGRLSELIQLDALKIAYVETGDREFLQQFAALRDKLVAAAWFGKKD
ncbi:MAG TPA: hypothetical protein VE756_09695 [Burkholderiales bacterium]|jgi:hypothetical protein|nr:hypothetical protein [Burkholderiales bacterium]